MATLVARILDESGFEAAVVCEFLGDGKLANTRKIVRLARDFDRQGGFTLAEFVARLRNDLENEPREEQAATTDEASASIRLMSIHQAKGLEFPIVVLPDLARAASSRSPLVALHPELGLVARPAEASPGSMANPEPNPSEPTADPTVGSFAWQAYQTLEKADDEQESLRLFYVAATRARDALILSAGLGPDEPVKSSSAAMKLLEERFDRRTGLCRVASEDLVATPAVQVSLMSPPAPRVDRTSTSLHLPISAIEEAITRATRVDRQDTSRPSPPPRYLDLDPAAGLPPRAARLDGLIRSILRDPAGVATRRSARLRSRRGSTNARREHGPDPRGRAADGCLVGRPALPGAQERRPVLHQARLCIHDSASIGWFVLGTDRFRGACDVLFRDRQGHWQLIVIADTMAQMARQHVRLQLSARAARSAGYTPIRQGWLVSHGPDGELNHEVVTGFDDAAIAQSVSEVIRSDSSGNRVVEPGGIGSAVRGVVAGMAETRLRLQVECIRRGKEPIQTVARPDHGEPERLSRRALHQGDPCDGVRRPGERRRRRAVRGDMSGYHIEREDIQASLYFAADLAHRPMPGRGIGMLTIISEDDEHLKDFAEYMP